MAIAALSRRLCEESDGRPEHSTVRRGERGISVHDGRSLSFARDSQPAQGLYDRHPRPCVPGRSCAGLYLGSGHVLYEAGQRYEPAVGLACGGYRGAPVGPVLPHLRHHRLSKLPDHTALPGTEAVLVHVLPLHPRGDKHLGPQVWCLATVELLRMTLSVSPEHLGREMVSHAVMTEVP